VRNIFIFALAALDLTLVSAPAGATTYTSVILSVPVTISGLQFTLTDPPKPQVSCSVLPITGTSPKGATNVPWVKLQPTVWSYYGPPISVAVSDPVTTMTSGQVIQCLVGFPGGGTSQNSGSMNGLVGTMDGSKAVTNFTLP